MFVFNKNITTCNEYVKNMDTYINVNKTPCCKTLAFIIIFSLTKLLLCYIMLVNIASTLSDTIILVTTFKIFIFNNFPIKYRHEIYSIMFSF